MMNNKIFNHKKSQIEVFVKAEYLKKFRNNSRISIRKRQKFMDEMTRKVSKRFGKDVLCLIDFSKGGFVTLVSPSHVDPTNLGKLYKSFIHPQLSYTSHCLDRFSERFDSHENCIILMDSLMNEALLTYGENNGHLTCAEGVFAYKLDNGRMIIKTYINFNLLSENQITKFYGSGTAISLPDEYLAKDDNQVDFMLFDDNENPPRK